MTQTIAIFIDAYRELNARKMFWVTLGLTVLFVLLFALFAPEGNTMKFFTLSWHQENASTWYKLYLLQTVLVSVWLSWAAVILALISTAGIFPDFVSGGSVDLYLSKPIGRVRLFFTKYTAALLFVILQATLFSILAFIVVGVRAGEWKWGLFLTIPLLTLFFSFLYCVSVLLGILTRSTIAALMLTLLLWLLIFGVHFAESLTLMFESVATVRAEMYHASAERAQRAIDNPPASRPATQPATHPSFEAASSDSPYGFGSGSSYSSLSPQERRQNALRNAAEAESSLASVRPWHRAFFITKTVLPKTSETIGLMSRSLFEEKELEEATFENLRRHTRQFEDEDAVIAPMSALEGQIRANKIVRERSVGWVIGTSLLFEIVILSLTAWIFYRRDY